jgi:hypothetical protein
MAAEKLSVAFPVQGLSPGSPVQPSLPDTTNLPIVPHQAAVVGGASVILVMTSKLPIESLALFIDWIMTVLPAPRRHGFQAALKPLPHGPNVDREESPPTPRMCVKPRKSKVAGFFRPRSDFVRACGPNSISRVLSG